MFIVAQTLDLTSLLIKALPVALRVLWPFLVFVVVVVLVRDVLLPLHGRRLEARKQAKWFAGQKSLADIQNVNPKQFENYCAVLFGKLGFSAKTTSYAKDGGVDVIATKDGQTHFIQCKKYITRKVTLSEVRDFYGAMADAGCRKGYFVTTGFFTLDAEQFAAGKQIELINGERLMEYLKQAGVDVGSTTLIAGSTTLYPPQTVKPASEKTCPKCSAKLVRRTAKRGANAGSDFWGCSSFPKCRFTAVL